MTTAKAKSKNVWAPISLSPSRMDTFKTVAEKPKKPDPMPPLLCVDGTRAHRWSVASPNGNEVLPGTCSRCKQTRTDFRASYIGDWVDLKSPSVQKGRVTRLKVPSVGIGHWPKTR